MCNGFSLSSLVSALLPDAAALWKQRRARLKKGSDEKDETELPISSPEVRLSKLVYTIDSDLVNDDVRVNQMSELNLT